MSIKWVITCQDRTTRDEVAIAETNTEREAERFCEMWGWFYDDPPENLSGPLSYCVSHVKAR